MWDSFSALMLHMLHPSIGSGINTIAKGMDEFGIEPITSFGRRKRRVASINKPKGIPPNELNHRVRWAD